MKKVSLLLLALLLLCAPAWAAGQPLVVDDAGLLSQAEFEDLTARAGELSEAYAMDVVILSTQSIGGKSAHLYGADWYEEMGYGRGARSDGVLLVISMQFRDWAIVTTGRGIGAFTDDTIDRMSEDIVPYFSRGDYAEGFARYLRDSEIVLKQAEAGDPYDVGNRVQFKTPGERLLRVAPYLALAALAVALVVLIVLIVRMNTARPQRDAGRYVRDGSFALDRAQDIYLFHTQTRVKVQKNSSSGGGGSSTFRSSSGGTHGGRSGKF